jgi:hypothetical protein
MEEVEPGAARFAAAEEPRKTRVLPRVLAVLAALFLLPFGVGLVEGARDNEKLPTCAAFESSPGP